METSSSELEEVAAQAIRRQKGPKTQSETLHKFGNQKGDKYFNFESRR